MSPDIEQPEAVTAAPASASEQSNQSAQAQPQPQQPQPLAVPTEGTAGGAGAEADTDVEILLGTGQPGQEEVDDTDSTECADKEPAGDKPLAQPVLTLRWALNELVDDIYGE